MPALKEDLSRVSIRDGYAKMSLGGSKGEILVIDYITRNVLVKVDGRNDLHRDPLDGVTDTNHDSWWFDFRDIRLDEALT